jgi:hypothetical protein
MVSKECNLRAGVYKVQTFGTLHVEIRNVDIIRYVRGSHSPHVIAYSEPTSIGIVLAA